MQERTIAQPYLHRQTEARELYTDAVKSTERKLNSDAACLSMRDSLGGKEGGAIPTPENL